VRSARYAGKGAGEIALEQCSAHSPGYVDRPDVAEAEGDVIRVQAGVRAPAVEPQPLVAVLSRLVGDRLNDGGTVALAVLCARHEDAVLARISDVYTLGWAVARARTRVRLSLDLGARSKA